MLFAPASESVQQGIDSQAKEIYMPIANYIVKNSPPPGAAERILENFSEQTGIPHQDITLNFMRPDAQAGKSYACMIFLYLPSLWTAQDVRRIEKALFDNTCKALNLTSGDVFLITTLTGSGHVVSDGEVEEW